MPHAFASSADMKWSRSVSLRTSSGVFPDASARIPLSISFRRRISRAVISMPRASPCAPPQGWCTLLRACGRAKRRPLAPAARRRAPRDAEKKALEAGVASERAADDDGELMTAEEFLGAN